MPLRKIIEIDEEKCTGCGECILSCAEGALAIVDGKAKLVGEILCDGLGACLGECPEGALKLVEREAEDFDEAAVEKRLADLGRQPTHDHGQAAHVHPAGGCPSAAATTLNAAPAGGCPSATAAVFETAPSGGVAIGGAASSLGHFPIKLQLLGPGAPFLRGADLVLLADCVATAYPDLHAKLLPGKAIAMGCPKLDDLEAHIQRLAEIIAGANIRSLTVAHMEVPCCHGFVYAAQEALKRSGKSIPLGRINISRDGRVIEEVLPQAA